MHTSVQFSTFHAQSLRSGRQRYAKQHCRRRGACSRSRKGAPSLHFWHRGHEKRAPQWQLAEATHNSCPTFFYFHPTSHTQTVANKHMQTLTVIVEVARISTCASKNVGVHENHETIRYNIIQYIYETAIHIIHDNDENLGCQSTHNQSILDAKGQGEAAKAKKRCHNKRSQLGQNGNCDGLSYPVIQKYSTEISTTTMNHLMQE